jgi:hypothetical protein
MKRSKTLELILNKKLPKEYKDFIDNYGFYRKDGIEIYGFDDSLDLENIPSVIGATKLYSKDYDIKDNELVIYFDDYINHPLLLNLDNGKIYSIDFEGNRKTLFDSFKEFKEQIFKEL